MEIHQIIKYVLDSRDLVLKIEPIQGNNEPSEIVCFSDSYCVGDPDCRRGVSGFELNLCRVLISWRSKAQCSGTLSRSDSEWVVASKAVKEDMSVLQQLQSI